MVKQIAVSKPDIVDAEYKIFDAPVSDGQLVPFNALQVVAMNNIAAELQKLREENEALRRQVRQKEAAQEVLKRENEELKRFRRAATMPVD